MEISFDRTLDTSGLVCPEPVMMLHREMRAAESGEVIKIVATDPATERDIPKFCQYLGHKLLDVATIDGSFLYFVQKK